MIRFGRTLPSLLRFLPARCRVLTVLAGLAILLVAGASARADPALDFNIPSDGAGSVHYNGGSNQLVGTGIAVDKVFGFGTPLNAGNPLAISNGALAFNTGAFTSFKNGTYSFDATGSSIAITGKTSATGSGVATLMNGKLTGTATVVSGNFFGHMFAVVFTAVFTAINDQVAAYFGIAPGLAWEGEFGLIFDAASDPNNPDSNNFQSTGLSGGNVLVTPVSAPSSLVLAGCGALGMLGYAWRRRKMIAASAG
jgi:hypothetical protein